MEQFVPVFLGEQPPPAPRAVTVQRCLRVAGAKSDIENVGRTGRHGTFLEMLGNFSFGDYYKREAIAFAWEFSTDVLRLDPASFYVTVHTGDDEAQRIWEREIGLAASRISRCDDDNFWTMGPTGPCGPCTEMFYDIGAAYTRTARTTTARTRATASSRSGTSSSSSTIARADGELHDLPRKAIDTGDGLRADAGGLQRQGVDVRDRSVHRRDRRAARRRADVARRRGAARAPATSSPTTRAR